MPRPTLSPTRRRSLIREYSYKIIASLPTRILHLLAADQRKYDKFKLTHPPSLERRIALVREFNGIEPPPPPPPPAIPEFYRNTKISHWYKDHLDRIGDMAADTVCKEAVGYEGLGSPFDAIGAFNAHIAPIAKLYCFELRMEWEADGSLRLRGDISKASSVLLYLSSQNRTPEIDWMLDTVTWFQIAGVPDRRPDKTIWVEKSQVQIAPATVSQPEGKDQAPFSWRKSWERLRHTLRGKWRKQREKQIARNEERSRAIEAEIRSRKYDSEIRPAINQPNHDHHRHKESDLENLAREERKEEEIELNPWRTDSDDHIGHDPLKREYLPWGFQIANKFK
jgi:hypothetical protein